AVGTLIVCATLLFCITKYSRNALLLLVIICISQASITLLTRVHFPILSQTNNSYVPYGLEVLSWNTLYWEQDTSDIVNVLEKYRDQVDIFHLQEHFPPPSGYDLDNSVR